MARVTIEDCVDKVDDRFELVALAGQRAKAIAAGELLTIERKDEKDTVLALREIAGKNITAEDLRENLIKSFQKERAFEDELEEEDFDVLPLSSEEIVASALQGDDLYDVDGEDEFSETVAEETAEECAADESAEEAESAEGVSFEEDNLEVDD